MAEKDRIIKSGQVTLPRLLFLAAVGGLIVLMVYIGGIWLTIGYWLLTLSIAAVLLLSAIDYGVKMEKVNFQTAETSPAVTPDQPVTTTPTETRAPTAEARPKRRSSRPAKRRR